MHITQPIAHTDAAAVAASAASPLPSPAAVMRCGIRLSGTGAGAATFPLLLPENVPAELVRGAATCAVPNAASWFCGLANLRGDLVPVFDLLSHCGIAAVARRKSDLLIVGTGATAFALPVQREPEVLRLHGVAAAAPPDALGDLVHTVWQGEDSLWFDFDFDHWLSRLSRGNRRTDT